MSKIEWEKLLQIEPDFIDKHIILQDSKKDFKLCARAYTIKFSGNLYNCKGLVEILSEIVGKFTHSRYEVETLGEVKALKGGEKIFGKIEPSKDGKYGELVLFALVESVLRCPMVAHKIPTSFNDQVKGGDGIFMGNYENEPGQMHQAILIGESKIWQQYAPALDDCLNSINRFHDSISKGQFNSQEFIVAKKGLIKSGVVDVDYIYKCLSPGEKEFQENITVHPVFIMYETNEIENIERKATSKQKAEELIQTYMARRSNEQIELIRDKLKSHKELSKVFLDFFILPVKNVEEFRNELYYEIHGVKFTSPKTDND